MKLAFQNPVYSSMNEDSEPQYASVSDHEMLVTKTPPTYTEVTDRTPVDENEYQVVAELQTTQVEGREPEKEDIGAIEKVDLDGN